MMKNNEIKQLALSMIFYAGASILAPLAVFGGAGYFFSQYFGGGKTFLFVGIGIAFVITNILQFFKVRKLLKKINEKPEKSEKIG